MKPRLPAWLTCLALLMAPSPAPAQLASQTALVGTVSDSGGGVLPGAQVVAVNLGTKDTFEVTTNGEGYYNIQFVRPGTYDVTVTLAGFQTFKATGVEVANNQVVRVNGVLAAGAVTETVIVAAAGAGPQHRQRDHPGDHRRTRRARAAVERPQRLEPRDDRAERHRRPDVGHRPELPRRRPARDPERPLPRRHQRVVEPAGGDQHAPHRRCRHRSAGADRQHLGRVRLLPRRPHQHRRPRAGPTTPHGAFAYYYQGDGLDSRGYFENRAAPKNPRTRKQFSMQADGPVTLPVLRRPEQDVLHGRL